MIKGKGYLKFSKSKNKIYVYLFGRLTGEEKKKNLFAFGRLENALENMYQIRESDRLPAELSELGFNFDDLDEWILALETRTTRNNKKINLPVIEERCFEDVTNYDLLGMSEKEVKSLNKDETFKMYSDLLEMIFGALAHIEELEEIEEG
ncbi:hypothetical protein [Carnobacterium divergens]|uniref:hypothetical protein n=1 Tax=Carnobacterium divergens TaxID=2748 RepID=UPI001875D119|nr:hypothetical protein [Carnobacterium divergens]